MPFTHSKSGAVATNGGNAASVFVPSAEFCRVSASRRKPLTAATRTPRSGVQFGANLKSFARSHRPCFLFCGTVKRATSSRSNACVGSQTSRTLTAMQCNAMQSQFQSIQARWRSHSCQAQKQSVIHQNPAPNPSIERTRTGRPRMAFISFWAMRALPARAAHVKR